MCSVHVTLPSVMITYLSRMANWLTFYKLKLFYQLGYTQFDNHTVYFKQLFLLSAQFLKWVILQRLS